MKIHFLFLSLHILALNSPIWNGHWIRMLPNLSGKGAKCYLKYFVL